MTDNMYESNLDNKLQKASKYVTLIGKFNTSNGVFNMRNAEHILMFDVNSLCDEPNVINVNKECFKGTYITDNKYTGMVKDQSVGKGLPGWFDVNSYDYEEQKIELYDFYKDQFILFQPDYQYQYKDNVYHKNLKILDIISIPQGMNIDTRFKVIPKINLDRRTFEKKIRKGEYFTLDSYPGDVYNNADYIMCDSYLYFSDSWEFNEADPLSWKCAKDGYVTYVKIENKSKMISNPLRFGSSIVFIDEEYTQELNETANVFEMYSEIKTENKDEENTLVEKEDIKIENNGELEMLTSFEKNVINSNLCYDFKDLINLHICAKSTPLTILAGMSGTGKTQLALQYAKMLDAQEVNGNLLFIPVSPSFTEPDDVLGYLNPNNGMYVPADTGLVDFLIEAQNNNNKMYIVIFDEMNLSQIEYWFSPFISILEKEGDSRYLTLYNKKSYCVNSSSYRYQVKINNNVIFIGTINLDETTKNISDRLLDRSFVINLKKKKFIDFSIQDIEKKTESIPKLNVCESSSLYNQWRSKETPIRAFNNRELEFLDKLHDMISKYDEQKGVSFRVLKNMGTYINNIPKGESGEGLIKREEAFDLVLKQTVMKKLSGPDNRLINLIGKIDNIGEEPRDSIIIDLFNEYSDISKFTGCRDSIMRKAEDLYTYGYTR